MPDPAGKALQEAIAVMDTLRSEGGCPWDREQTHASLAPYAVEEAHEVAEAAESGDREELIEELGDLLLQVLFHARVGAEGSLGRPFDLEDVAATLVAKLRRRHPHVFARSEARTSAEVTARWDVIKAQEKQRESVLDGIPAGLPALARTQKMLSRAERAGIDIATDAMAERIEREQVSGEPAGTEQVSREQITREQTGLARTSPAPAGGARPGTESAGPAQTGPAQTCTDPTSQIGAELFQLVRRAQAAGVDAEAALRGRARELDEQIRTAEQARPGRPAPPSRT